MSINSDVCDFRIQYTSVSFNVLAYWQSQNSCRDQFLGKDIHLSIDTDIVQTTDYRCKDRKKIDHLRGDIDAIT